MAVVCIDEVRRFMVDSLLASGAPTAAAEAQADLLIHADAAGHFSHGLNRLDLYINDMKNGGTNPKATPVILKESGATAWVDGCDALGATTGGFCMDLAIQKAREFGVGWVVAKRCLLPLGGFEGTSGYKGYGLSAMVEVLCSGLSGSNPSHKIQDWSHNQTESPNLGQCFVAVDPERFAPGFGPRLSEYLQHWRRLEPLDTSLPVLAPGDKEKQSSVITSDCGTLYPQRQIEFYRHVTETLGVKPMSSAFDPSVTQSWNNRK